MAESVRASSEDEASEDEYLVIAKQATEPKPQPIP